MPGPANELFQEDVGDAERGPGLAAGLIDAIRSSLSAVMDDAHAAAAAAHRRLDHDRVAELLGELWLRPASSDRLFAAGEDRAPGGLARCRGPRPCRPVVPASSARGPTNVMPAPRHRPERTRRSRTGSHSPDGWRRLRVLSPTRRCRESRDTPGSARPACRRGTLRPP